MLRGFWRKFVVGLLVGLPLLAVLGYYVALPWYIRRGTYNAQIEEALGAALGLQVRLGALTGPVLDGVSLREVVGVDPETGATVLEIEQVDLTFTLDELRAGQVRSVHVLHPKLRLERGAEAWNWALLRPRQEHGPVVLPGRVDAITVTGADLQVRTEDLVMRVWDLDLDLGAIDAQNPIRVGMLKPARAAVEQATAYDIDPSVLDSRTVSVQCAAVDLRPITGPPGISVQELEIRGENLDRLNALLQLPALRPWNLTSAAARIRADLSWDGHNVQFGLEGDTPGLRLRAGTEPWTECGSNWALHGNVSLDSGEVLLDRCRVDTEKYGAWQAVVEGSWQTMDFLIRDLRVESLRLEEVSRIPWVAGTGWSFLGGALLGDVSGRVHRDAATREWQVLLSGGAMLPRIAADFEGDYVRLAGEGLDCRWNLTLDSRSRTVAVGIVGGVAKLGEAGGGYEFQADRGVENIVVQARYAWQDRIFTMTQLDARLLDLTARRAGGETLLRFPEPVAISLDFQPGPEDRPAPFRFDREQRRVVIEGMHLRPRRGGEMEVWADIDLRLKAFRQIKGIGRQVDLAFLQKSTQESLGRAATEYSVSGLADFDLDVRPLDEQGTSYDAVYRLRGDALSVEAVTDPRPVGVTVDAGGKAVYDSTRRTLRLHSGRARLGDRGQADYIGVIDLATWWPETGTVTLSNLDGPWLGDLVRRVTRFPDDVIAGGGQMNGTVTFGTMTIGDRKDAKIVFDGNIMRSTFVCKAVDVEFGGRQIDVRVEAILPGRSLAQPVVSFQARMAAGTARSEMRQYEGSEINLAFGGDFRIDRAHDRIEGEAELRVTRAEFLWDTLYDPIFKDPMFVQFKGGWNGDEHRLRIDRMACQHPNFGESHGKGEMTYRKIDGNYVVIGRLELAETSCTVKEVSVIGLGAVLPFRLGWPELPASELPEGIRENDWARVRIEAIERGRFRMEGVDVEVAIVGDRILTRRPIELPIFGGVLRLANFTGRNLIPRSVNEAWKPEWQADLEVDGVRPELALWAGGNDRKLPGVCRGRFAHARFGDAMLDLQDGELQVDILGGRATVRNMRLRHPLTQWRLECDADLKGAQWSELCRIFPELGQIEGTVDVAARGVAVLEGTPIEFDLDVDNHAYSGEGGAQTINHHAAQNLGYLGGGVSGLLESNVTKRNFKYIHFGVGARMRYHPEFGKTFVHLRGKYQRTSFGPIASYKHFSREDLGEDLDAAMTGNAEYFMVGATTSGVNLINGDPKGLVDYEEIFRRVKGIIEHGAEGMHIK